MAMPPTRPSRRRPPVPRRLDHAPRARLPRQPAARRPAPPDNREHAAPDGEERLVSDGQEPLAPDDERDVPDQDGQDQDGQEPLAPDDDRAAPDQDGHDQDNQDQGGHEPDRPLRQPAPSHGPYSLHRPDAQRASYRRMRRRRRRTLMITLLLVSAGLISTDLGRVGPGDRHPAARLAADAPLAAGDATPDVLPAGLATAPPGLAAGEAFPLTTPGTAATASPRTRPAGYPQTGPGRFEYATGQGPLLGTAGMLRRFHLAVEDGMGQRAASFAASVDAILGDRRSWIASKRVRLRRVPSAATAEFTIYLATPGTSTKMCAVGGLNTDGFTSCRLPGKVIINVARWLEAIPDYGAPLAVYQAYAVNHAVGHQLGYGHEACPGAGRPAPVMQEQTYGLAGCRAYAWPYLGGRRYAGPEVP